MLATAITDHIVGLRRRPNSTTINASTNIYSNFSDTSASTNIELLLNLTVCTSTSIKAANNLRGVVEHYTSAKKSTLLCN